MSIPEKFPPTNDATSELDVVFHTIRTDMFELAQILLATKQERNRAIYGVCGEDLQ